MVCLGLEPRAVVCKAQTNPLSYGDTPREYIFMFNCLGRNFLNYSHDSYQVTYPYTNYQLSYMATLCMIRSLNECAPKMISCCANFLVNLVNALTDDRKL